MGKNSSSFSVIRFLTILFAVLTGAFMLIGGGLVSRYWWFLVLRFRRCGYAHHRLSAFPP